MAVVVPPLFVVASAGAQPTPTESDLPSAMVSSPLPERETNAAPEPTSASATMAAAPPSSVPSRSAATDATQAANLPPRMALGAAASGDSIQTGKPPVVSRSPDKQMRSVNESPRWSVGAGLGATYSGLSVDAGALSNSNLGILGNGSVTPAVSPLAFLEYRIQRGLFLFVQLEGYYTQGKVEGENKSRYLGGHTVGPGLHWVANPGGPVEIGMAHTVCVSSTYYRVPTGVTTLGSNTTNGDAKWATPTTQTFGTATAIVAERMLVPQLWVRVAATMFRASLSKTTFRYENENGTSSAGHQDSASIRFAFEPSISLRLAF